LVRESSLFLFQEAYGGWTSGILWVLVLHSAQREVRERHHYTVDCIVAIYVGILLWRATRFLWSADDTSKARRAAKFDEVQTRLVQSAKDYDIDKIRKILEEVEIAGQDRETLSKRAVIVFGSAVVLFTFTCVLLALTLTADG
jgi:CHASE3 domain sensor protein